MASKKVEPVKSKIKWWLPAEGKLWGGDKSYGVALTGVAQWVGCHPENQKVAGLIPVRAHACVVGQVPY